MNAKEFVKYPCNIARHFSLNIKITLTLNIFYKLRIRVTLKPQFETTRDQKQHLKHMVPSFLEFNSFCTRSSLATNNKEFIATSARIMVRSTEQLTLHNILKRKING